MSFHFKTNVLQYKFKIVSKKNIKIIFGNP